MPLSPAAPAGTALTVAYPLYAQVLTAADRAARAELERDHATTQLQRAQTELTALNRAASEARVKAAEATARAEAVAAQVRVWTFLLGASSSDALL